MIKKFGVISLMLMLATTAFAAEEINIVGSTTVLPIAQATAEAYMEKNPGVSITVGGGGSSVGAKGLLAGTCDIADCSRALKQSEIEEAAKHGIVPKPHVVAMDGIAVVVNKANAQIANMSLKDIQDIYTGKVSDWAGFGGSGQIVVVSRDTSSGTYEAFNELALNKEKVRADALLQASNQAVLTTVAQTPGAIGYVGIGYLTKDVHVVTVENVMPTAETVLSKAYPIARPLYMYTNGEPKGAVAQYLEFVKSAEGQAIAEKQGFVGLK